MDGGLRVIDEIGEDYLFPADYFVLIDASDETTRMLVGSYRRGLEPVPPQPIS